MRPLILHPWVKPIGIAYLPGPLTPAIESVVAALTDALRAAGCRITDTPGNDTDLILTTSRYGALVDRDESLLFHAKRKFRLSRRPQVLTLFDIPEPDYQSWLRHFDQLAHLPESAVRPEQFPGLGPEAAGVIAHQARRGGPELALSRLIQAQMLSIRVMVIRTLGDQPLRAMHFDLAGARPVTELADPEQYGAELAGRVLAAVCTEEVNHHSFLDDPLPAETWAALRSPEAMIRAGAMFTEFGFFTTPILVEQLIGFRGISDALSAQYSEGCYAVFDPDIGALITTATGSSRLVDKRTISRHDQAVVVGVRPDRQGAIVRPVAGHEPVVPSVEAVEMMGICEAVATHTRLNSSGVPVRVSNVSAVLHGHLGVAAFDPGRVEAVYLDPLFYTQLVSCGTAALARATAIAFARSEALADLNDPRRVVFLEQPGHGVVVVERWPPPGQQAELPHTPFSTIRECLEAGHLRMALDIPQGPVNWAAAPTNNGRHLMHKASEMEPARLG